LQLHLPSASLPPDEGVVVAIRAGIIANLAVVWGGLAQVCGIHSAQAYSLCIVGHGADVKTGGTYLNYTFSDFRTLNWFMTREVASLPNILGGWGLFAVDPTNLQPIPYMAESYTLSPDRLVWTIQLRSGMKWSDETPITAKDFVTTVAIARDPDTKSVRRDDFMLGDRPIRFEAITATTLRVTFPNLDVSAFDTLSFAVQPAHVFGPVYAKKGGAGVRELSPRSGNERAICVCWLSPWRTGVAEAQPILRRVE
jgi:peptide/nickel transport system substrate-binding protein